MSVMQSRQNSERILQWEELMRKFAQAHKKECKSVSLDIPRVQRSGKRFPTGSEYEGTWDMLGMSGYGVYKFSNGVIYEGQFYDGVFHGDGNLIYPSGITLHTTWRRGELVHRTLTFADGSEYNSSYSSYCELPDRRFVIEYNGLQPAGQSYLTAEQPTVELPHGYYDSGDGLYDPKTKVIYKADDLNSIIRAPSECEQKWIVENCRMSPMGPLGPRQSLYEEWTKPSMTLSKPCKPMQENVDSKTPSMPTNYKSKINESNISWKRNRQSSKWYQINLGF